jgi:hypothetical protein
VKLLEVKIGDTLRDCDPRTKVLVRDKVVIAVHVDHVSVRNNNTHRTTNIFRSRLHDDANKKSGYLLIPFSGAAK